MDFQGDVDFQGPASDYETALRVASTWGHDDAVQRLLRSGVDANGNGRNYGTVLQAASARGHKDIVILLLGSDADPNFAGGDYGSALCAACANGHEDLVNILLGNKKIVKNIGSKFGAPLHIAILLSKTSIIEALVQDAAEAADCQWMHTQLKAVDIAVLMGKYNIRNILEGGELTGYLDLSKYEYSPDPNCSDERQDALDEKRRQLQQLVNRDTENSST